MSHQIHEDNGVQRGVHSFYKHLPLLNMRCDLDPSRLAVWWSAEHCLRLSTFAAQTLANAKRLTMQSLTIHRSKEYGKYKNLSEFSTSSIFSKVTQLSGLTELLRKSSFVKDTMVSIRGRSHTSANLDLEIEEESKNKDIISVYSDTQDDSRQESSELEQPSKKNKVVKAIKGTARQIISLSAQAVQKKSASLGLANPPVSLAYAVQSDIEEHKGRRQTRLVDGREAVRLGTKAQRLHIIKRFDEELLKTPQRKKLYQEANGVELEKSSTDEENKLGSVKDGVTKV